MAMNKGKRLVALLVWVGLGIILLSEGVAAEDTIATTDMKAAIEEMKGASYYGFVMLLQMAGGRVPFDNITFLMPDDKALAEVTANGVATESEQVVQLLLKHSVPGSLRLNNMLHFPTGTLIPSSVSPYMINVTNHGKTNFFLNEALVVNPNICRLADNSICCHGINKVLSYPSPSPPPPPPSGPNRQKGGGGGSPSPSPSASYSPTSDDSPASLPFPAPEASPSPQPSISKASFSSTTNFILGLSATGIMVSFLRVI